MRAASSVACGPSRPQLAAPSSWSPVRQFLKQAPRQVAVQVAAPVMEPQQSSQYETYPTEAARRSMFTTEVLPEQEEEIELTVQGQIPDWLKGAFVRNGPGTFKHVKHMFDGYGMLVKFSIASGKVHVSRSFVKSEAYKRFKATGTPQFSEFGTQIGGLKGLWNTALGLLGIGQGFTDNASVSVLGTPDGRQLIAMTETVIGTIRVDTATLHTLGRVKYTDRIKGDFTTAHPTLQPDGSLINLASGFQTHYTVFRQDRGGTVRSEIARVPFRTPPTPSWVHDFPVTPNYAVVPETPCVFNLKASVFGGGQYAMFDWKPELGTRLHVVPLAGGPVRVFEAPPFFTFHYLNAFETPDGRALCFDFPHFKDPAMLNNLWLDSLRTNARPIETSPIKRLTIPLDNSSSEVRLESLMKDDAAYTFCELPRVNPLYRARARAPFHVLGGKEYRYAYSVAARLPTSYGNALAKFDLRAGTCVIWHESGTITNEPLMIPRPGAQAEDDGAVLTVVMGADGKSFLLILDAASFTEVARAPLPYGIPYGFHSTFVPAGLDAGVRMM